MREHTRSFRLPITILPLALALAGCDAASAEPAYIGKTYTGRVTAEIATSDLPITQRRSGRATAEFERTAPGKARLIVTGDIRGQNASLTIDGSYDDSGFRGADDQMQLTIDNAETITGHGADKESLFRFSGTVAANDMTLILHWRPAAGAPPTPLESIEFAYTLEQDASEKGDASAKRPTGKDGKPCTRTRVEQRVSPSFDGGPMTMGMVVVCAD